MCMPGSHAWAAKQDSWPKSSSYFMAQVLEKLQALPSPQQVTTQSAPFQQLKALCSTSRGEPAAAIWQANLAGW
jgi:hypothetical protein